MNIAFSTSHAFAGDKDAGITAFSLQFDFNPQKVGTWAQITRGVDWRVSHMPRFSVRASNQTTSDDENSVQGGWNIEFQRAFRASAVETPFHRPPLRYAAFSIGPNFEFTKDGKNGNMLVPLEGRLYLPKTIGRIQAVQGELIGGLEVGRVMSSTSNVLLSNINPEAGASRAKIAVPLDIDQNIRRFHAGARFSLNLAPTRVQEFESKLEITADYRRLGTKELYFGKVEFPGSATVQGLTEYFQQKYGISLAPEFAQPRTVITLREPRAEKGNRRYFNAQYQFTLKSGFGFFAGFTRGELAPAFQFVNKFETGVNFRL